MRGDARHRRHRRAIGRPGPHRRAARRPERRRAHPPRRGGGPGPRVRRGPARRGLGREGREGPADAGGDRAPVRSGARVRAALPLRPPPDPGGGLRGPAGAAPPRVPRAARGCLRLAGGGRSGLRGRAPRRDLLVPRRPLLPWLTPRGGRPVSRPRSRAPRELLRERERDPARGAGRLRRGGPDARSEHRRDAPSGGPAAPAGSVGAGAGDRAAGARAREEHRRRRSPRAGPLQAR